MFWVGIPWNNLVGGISTRTISKNFLKVRNLGRSGQKCDEMSSGHLRASGGAVASDFEQLTDARAEAAADFQRHGTIAEIEETFIAAACFDAQDC